MPPASADPRSRLGVGDALAAGLLALVALGLGGGAVSIAYDDAWITYRYAYHFATGQGLVYNLGERFLGTTAPGYAVLLGILGWPAPDAIPAISAALCVLALAACGLAFYAFGRAGGHRVGGLLAGAFFIVNPVALEAFGGEMVPQAALALWAFAAQVSGRPTLAVSLALGAAIARPDGLLVLGLVGLNQTWRARRWPARQVVLAGLVLGVWFGALWWYYGWPLPQTLGAKNAQRVSGVWRPLGIDLPAWIGAFTTYGSTLFPRRPAPGFTTLLHLGAVGLVALLWLRHWWLLLAWPVCYVLAYRQMHLPFYHWYAVPPLVLIVVSAGAAVEMAVQVIGRAARRAGRAPGREGGRLAAAVPAAITLIVLATVALPLASFSATLRGFQPGGVERAYEALGRWFATQTPPGASVGYLEFGILGYHARRTIIDPLGLVNPGVTAHVARRDLLYAYRTLRPDYIVHNPAFFPDLLGIVLREPWFQREYRPVATLASGRPDPVVIYRRGAGVPPAETAGAPARSPGPFSPPAGGGPRSP